MVDYEKVDKLVENCKKLYPDMPDYVLWVLACDYYINEENDDEDDDILAQEGSPARRENTRARDELKEKREQIKKEALESFLKAKDEFKTTKYENIKVV
jgi:hypothetical protein